MEDIVIEAKQVSCKSGYQYLLGGIDWQIRRGERWVVFGMNGSGKTTLLSIIAGFHHYTSGEVWVFGEPMAHADILEIRRQIGWVSASFFDKYYGRESVMDIVLSAKFGTLGRREPITLSDRKRAKRLLAELDLERQAEYTFDLLSKGERQNVLIARALFTKPCILILDEPFTGLDVYNRQYLAQTLERLAAKENLTLLYVTHYVEEITPMFEHCLLLKNGHSFAQGLTKDLLNDENLSTFLERPVKINTDEKGRLVLDVLNIEPKLVDLLL